MTCRRNKNFTQLSEISYNKIVNYKVEIKLKFYKRLL